MNPNTKKGMEALTKWRKKFRWTEEEVNLILNNHKKKSDRELSELLPNRTPRTIGEKRLSLGIKRPQRDQIWTNEEIKILEDNWKEYDQNELHEKFLPNKTPKQINARKMHSGLKGKKYVWSDKEKEIFIEKAHNHTNEWLRQKFFKNKTIEQIRCLRRYFGIKING
jgi:hypothetical protein